MAELKKDLGILESELSAYGDSNPAKVEEIKRAAFLAKEAVYRWTGKILQISVLLAGYLICTDNYGVLLGHFTRQNGISAEDVRQYLSIPEDYEDLE